MNDYNNGNYYSQNQNMNTPDQNYYDYNSEPQQTPGPNPGPKNGSPNIIPIIIISAVLVVAVVFGIMSSLQNKNDSGTLATGTTVSNPVSSVYQNQTVPSVVVPETSAAADVSVPETAPNLQYSSSSPVASWAETTVGEVLGSSNIDSSRSFGADQAIDGYANTCWCVNTSKSAGAGGSFTVHLKESSRVSGVAIINGNTFKPEESLYRLNGQVNKFTLIFSNGSSLSFTASYNKASSQYEVFRFPAAVTTDTITFRVDSGYQGDSFTTNVCLGELNIF